MTLVVGRLIRSIRSLGGFRIWILTAAGPILLSGNLGFDKPMSARAQVEGGWPAMQLSVPGEAANTPKLAADPMGRLHAVWSIEATSVASGGLVYARNDGRGWLANDIVLGDADSPSLFVGHDLILHLVWVQARQLLYSFAPADGALSAQAWSTPRVVAEGTLYFPNVFETALESLVIVVADLGEPSRLVVLRSVDGVSWDEASPSGEADVGIAIEYPEYANSADGTIHLTWSLVPTDSYYGGLGVMYSRSSDDGVTWTVPTRLDQFGQGSEALGAWQSSIQVVGDNEIHVIWDAHAKAGMRYHQRSSDRGASWSEPSPLPGGLVSQTGSNPMVVDDLGRLHLLTAGTFDWSEPQGIYQLTWDGTQWSVPTLAHQGTDEPHWLSAIGGPGSTIQLVWEAREQQPRAAWFGTSADVAGSTLQISYVAADPIRGTQEDAATTSQALRGGTANLSEPEPNRPLAGETIIRRSPRSNPSQALTISGSTALVTVLVVVAARRLVTRRPA